ncbi:MAG: hypothetical protein PHV45_05535 [Desulfuromonas thiophila]|nr:hypothetical protein [Desulfuromonas thiophila]
MTQAADSVRAADIDAFIARWQASGGAERANYQLFLTGLCDLLDLPQPEPTRPDDRDNAYVFERTVTLQQGDGSATPNYIDLYKRGCFILEAKQGSDKNPPLVLPELAARRKAGTARRGTGGWDRAMQAAKNQAERYAKALPLAEGWPPFLLVVDVGHSIELYSEFSCSGKTYLPFPDVRSHRIFLTDLRDAAVRDRLRQVWSAPHSLDPAQRSARVTREVSDQLARIAKSLETALLASYVCSSRETNCWWRWRFCSACCRGASTRTTARTKAKDFRLKIKVISCSSASLVADKKSRRCLSPQKMRSMSPKSF